MATQRFGAISPGRLNNETTTAPAATDDSGDGYAIGSEWYDTTANIIYKCIDSTVGAAVWVRAGESAAMMPMGEINFTGNSTATTITTQDTPTKVAITTTLSVSDEFDSPSAGRLRYTGATTKTFHCGCTISIKSAGANDIVRAYLYKTGGVNGNNEFTSGTALTAGTVDMKLSGAGDIASTAIHVMVSLAQNDYLEVAIENKSDTDDFTVQSMNLFSMAAPYTAATPAGSEAFPVGGVYINVTGVNPATELGYGTWSAFGAGRVLVGLDSGDTDFDTVEETGGAKTVSSSAQTFAGNALATHQHAAVSAGTPAGTNAAEDAHTHSVTTNVAVGDHASHTHTYTEVPNHTHTVNVGSANDTSTVTGSGNYFAGTTNTVTATTANPTGGVATGTTAGPSATLSHSVTNNAVTSGAGSSHNHAFTGTAMGTHQHDAISAGTPAGTNTPGAATSVVQPYIVVHFWKRTA